MSYKHNPRAGTRSFERDASRFRVLGVVNPVTVGGSSGGNVVAGAGLTGGGEMPATITLTVGAGNGISVAADAVAVNQAYAFGWTGAQTWSNTVTFNGAAEFNSTIQLDGAATFNSSAEFNSTAQFDGVATHNAALAVASSNALTFGGDVSLSRTAANFLTLASGDALGCTYTSGWSGSGFTLNYNQTYASEAFLEIDRLSVRGIMNVYELLIHQIRATNGSIFVANTGKCLAVGGGGGGVYTIATETDHGFEADDLIRAQRFSGSSVWRSDLTVISYIDSTHFTAQYRAGSTIPAAGMEYVRLGNVSDTTRQGSIYLTADDTNAPYINILAGVASFTDWGTEGKTKGRFGKMTGAFGITADAYGAGMGDYTGGNYLVYDDSGGFLLSAGDGAVTIDANGIRTKADYMAYEVKSGYRILSHDSDQSIAALLAFGDDNDSDTVLRAYGDHAYLTLEATQGPDPLTDPKARLYLATDSTGETYIYAIPNFYVGATPGAAAADYNFGVQGDALVGGGLYVGSGATAWQQNPAEGNVVATADVLAGGGLSVGDTGVNPATGQIIATADGRFGGGLYVGSTASGPGDGNLLVTADIRAGAGLCVGDISIDPTAGVLSWHGNTSFPGAIDGTTVTTRARAYHSNANGLVLYGYGTSYDVLLANRAGSATMTIAANSTNVHLWGDLELDGALNHDGSTVGFYGTSPASQYAYFADENAALVDSQVDNTNEVRNLFNAHAAAINKLHAALVAIGVIAAA